MNIEQFKALAAARAAEKAAYKEFMNVRHRTFRNLASVNEMLTALKNYEIKHDNRYLVEQRYMRRQERES